jgi:soluble lytic murein transglycosylase-like protein
MLAIDELNQIEPVLFFGTFNYTQSKIEENLKRRNEIHKFYFDEYFTRYYEKSQINTKQALKELKENTSFKVGLLLLFSGYQADANRFFALSTNYMSFNDVKLAFDLLNFYLTKVNDSSKTLILNTFASKASNQGVILVESYPLLDFIVNEKNIYPNPLIHAIIKQESNFTIRAISGPGAIGLMQVIPTTGKIVTRSANIEFNIHRLKNDYKYNIQIGSYYLDIVLNRFNQSYPFALIGYNAGPNRVSSWQKRYLEPKNLDEMLDFIELIPFKETREYVLRVMENEVIYNYLIKHHLSGSLLPLEKKDNDFNEFLRQNVQPQKVNFKQ